MTEPDVTESLPEAAPDELERLRALCAEQESRLHALEWANSLRDRIQDSGSIDPEVTMLLLDRYAAEDPETALARLKAEHPRLFDSRENRPRFSAPAMGAGEEPDSEERRVRSRYSGNPWFRPGR